MTAKIGFHEVTAPLVVWDVEVEFTSHLLDPRILGLNSRMFG